MRTTDRRSALLLVAALGLAGAAAPARAQSAAPSQNTPPSSAQPAVTEVDAERAALPHPILMTSIDEALGAKSPDSLRLTPPQRKDVDALHTAFDKQVRDFIRAHTDVTASGSGHGELPSREGVERKILESLRPDQRAALESALKNAAAKRVDQRHSSDSKSAHDSHSESHTSGQSSGSGQSQSDSHSSHSSDHKESSSSQHDSKSAHDSKSDKQSSSDQKSSGNQQSSSDKKSSSDQKSSSESRKSWSTMDQNSRREALQGLLDQLPAKDREALLKDLPALAPAKR